MLCFRIHEFWSKLTKWDVFPLGSTAGAGISRVHFRGIPHAPALGHFHAGLVFFYVLPL